MADFKIGNITPSSGKLKVGNVEVSKLYNGATLIWQNAFVFSTRAQLDAAINLWISDNVAALATYGEINTWKFEANASLADFSYLFLNRTTFNSDISNWDVSNVTDMFRMFDGAGAFNQPIGDWDVSNVTNMRAMFYQATSFNQSLNSWDVSSVTSMWGMFEDATNFNGNISSWNTGSVTETGFMFREATSFNGDISAWDMSSVIKMPYMFYKASAFNQDINTKEVNINGETYTAWDVSSVGTGTGPGTDDMQGVFSSASAFNQDLSSWDVSNVTDMQDMFFQASSFNQNLGSWDVSSVTKMNGMFRQTSLDTTNYDALLTGWNALISLQSNVTFDAIGAEYCSTAAENARTNLTSTYNWSITDGGQAAGCP